MLDGLLVEPLGQTLSVVLGLAGSAKDQREASGHNADQANDKK